MVSLFLPVLLFVVFAAALSIALALAGRLLGPHRESAVKRMPYESGMDPIHDSRRRFDVRFHLVAIAFLVFDVELLFLYPWAVILRDLKHFGLWEMFVYIGIVLVGFFYVWNKGVLDWGPEASRRGLKPRPSQNI